MPAFVILSEAKNLMDLGTYTSEILRLTPQNDVVGQPVRGDFLAHSLASGLRLREPEPQRGGKNKNKLPGS